MRGVLVPVMAILIVVGAASYGQKEEPKQTQPAEVANLLGNLKVDESRTYKNMVVFPIRYMGKQAPGEWVTMSKAVEAGHIKIQELPNATVPEVEVENLGDKTVFLLSGELIAGGKQTRVIRKDTVIEARQKVKVPVFCVEQRRWTGGREFRSSGNYLPSSLNSALKQGAGQSEVWMRVESQSMGLDVSSSTSSLDEILNSEKAQQEFETVHKELGKFSPPETIGIAIADARTGKVIGLELFGRRDLFEELQDKLVEGYAADLVLALGPTEAMPLVKVTEKDVQEFIARVASLPCTYEDTPGSGRGINMAGGTLQGKGVALGEHVLHLSVQEAESHIQPVRPIVDEPRYMPFSR